MRRTRLDLNSIYHHPVRRIHAGKTSFAIWSLNPSADAVIFVHGFGGRAGTTWPLFPDLLPQRAEIGSSDMVFYGYEGLRARTFVSAQLLRTFVEQLCLDPAASIINPSLAPAHHRSPFKYRTVTIVAHSTGAVVARQALLDASQDGNQEPEWLSTIRLVLFAPAHLGASIAPLQAAILAGSFPVLAIQMALNFRAPIWRDVLTDGDTITSLRARTQKALHRTSRRGHLVAKRVIAAELDNIVTPGQFCDDPLPIVLPGHDHYSVCKPRNSSDEPLRMLLESLR